MPRQSNSRGRAGAAIRTTRWPGPITDDHWRARTRLPVAALPAGWAEFIGGVPWTRAWSLTFDPKRRECVGQELASREAFSWANQAARVRRWPIAWAYATERAPSGRWHAHALTTDISDEVEEYLLMDWRLRNGHVQVQPVGDGVKAVLYLAKAAAANGEVVCSDTLIRYRDRLNDVTVVELWPER